MVVKVTGEGGCDDQGEGPKGPGQNLWWHVKGGQVRYR